MWKLETEWYELVLRSAAVFSFLFIVFRVWGKKHFGQLAPFDLVILLIISEAVQNAIIDDEKSITGAFITVGTMVLLNIILNRSVVSSQKAEEIIQGVPKVLIRNGQVDQKMQKSETITDQELLESLRREGVKDIEDVGLATIETNGDISVVKKEDMQKTH